MSKILCIGGPWSGKRASYTGMPSLAVPIYNDVCPVFDATVFPTADPEVNLAHYKLEIFREKHSREDIKVWVAEGTESVFKLLMESYERLHEFESLRGVAHDRNYSDEHVGNLVRSILGRSSCDGEAV